MQKVAEYLRNAGECMKLAQQQLDAAMREELLELARQWNQLATAREEFLKFIANEIGKPPD